MRSTSAHATPLMCILIVTFGVIGAAPCTAQTPVTSLEELRRQLADGDFITVVQADGQPVAGRLVRFGTVDLDLRLATKYPTPARGARDVTIRLNAIQSLERRRDSARNGAALGAVIGAGLGGAMFVHALVIDRNELDEWAASYVGAAAVSTGIGALIGWAVDAAHSKPHVRFDASSARRTALSVQPVYSRRGGIGLAVAFSR